MSVPALERRARELLPATLFDAMFGTRRDCDRVGGTDAANVAAFGEYAVLPRVLRDVSRRDTRARLLGLEVAAPVALAPIGALDRVHPGGEIAAAAGAEKFGTVCVVSAVSGTGFRRIATETGAVLWSQIYPLQDRDLLRRLIEHLVGAGSRALVVTVDNPGVVSRERSAIRPARGSADWGTFAELGYDGAGPASGLMVEAVDPAFTWRDLEWIREVTDLPLVLKGIQCAEDARLAQDCGVDAIVVSNHGGHAMPAGRPVLHELPGIVDRAPGLPVLVDGGVRTGADLFTALALGASGVLVGRLQCWALAAGGADGVLEMLSALRGELLDTMAFAGVSAVGDIGPHCLRPGR